MPLRRLGWLAQDGTAGKAYARRGAADMLAPPRDRRTNMGDRGAAGGVGKEEFARPPS